MSLNYPYWGIGADLVITTNGSDYDALLRYNGTEIKRTNSGIMTLVDWARGIAGNDIVVEFGKGDFVLDDEFDVTGSRTVIRGQGMDVTELILGNGINKDVIDITAARYVNVKIHDLKLNGNSDNNPTGGDCINASIASGAAPESMGWWLQFYNLRLYNAKDKGMEVAMTTTPSSPQILIYNVRAWSSITGPQLYFKNCYDSLYYALWGSSMEWDQGCTKSNINMVYVGGGGTMMKLGGDQILADNIRIDNVATGNYALRVYGDGCTVRCQISNKVASTADTAIRISGVANYIKAHFTDDAFGGGGHTYNYLVSEAAGSDYNLVDVIQPYTLNSVGISNMVGGHSVVNRLI